MAFKKAVHLYYTTWLTRDMIEIMVLAVAQESFPGAPDHIIFASVPTMVIFLW